MRVLKTGQGKVLDLAVCPDSRAVAAAVYDAGVLLWNLAGHGASLREVITCPRAGALRPGWP